MKPHITASIQFLLLLAFLVGLSILGITKKGRRAIKIILGALGALLGITFIVLRRLPEWADWADATTGPVAIVGGCVTLLVSSYFIYLTIIEKPSDHTKPEERERG